MDDIDRFLRSLGIAGCDVDLAIVIDVNFAAGLSNDVTNDFAARANDFADLVHWDRDRRDPWSEEGHFSTGRFDRFRHFAQDMKTSFLGLSQSRAHDVFIDAFDLDVHLNSGNAIFRAGDFEVHIAQVIFVTENVGENRNTGFFFDETHSNTGYWLRIRNPGIHQRHRSAAD